MWRTCSAPPPPAPPAHRVVVVLVLHEPSPEIIAPPWGSALGPFPGTIPLAVGRRAGSVLLFAVVFSHGVRHTVKWLTAAFLLKGPELWATPRSCGRGQLRASQRLSGRAAKAEGPQVEKRDGSRWDAFRWSSVAALKKAALWQGRESNAKVPERNPLSIWCPDPRPQTYLSLTRQTLWSHRSRLHAASRPLAQEGTGIGDCP